MCVFGSGLWGLVYLTVYVTKVTRKQRIFICTFCSDLRDVFMRLTGHVPEVGEDDEAGEDTSKTVDDHSYNAVSEI